MKSKLIIFGLVLTSLVVGIQEILPNTKSSFELSLPPHEMPPASYDLLVIVQRYQLIPIARYPLLLAVILVLLLFVIYMKKRRGW